MNFSSPVAITAGTTYVASYHTNVGHYADDQNYFTSQYNSGSLHVPANGGVYAYGAAGSFPTQAWNASNYWVDVVLSPSGSPSIATTATAKQSVSVLTAVAPSSDASSQLVDGRVHPTGWSCHSGPRFSFGNSKAPGEIPQCSVGASGCRPLEPSSPGGSGQTDQSPFHEFGRIGRLLNSRKGNPRTPIPRSQCSVSLLR